jgi:hypothetical protein
MEILLFKTNVFMYYLLNMNIKIFIFFHNGIEIFTDAIEIIKNYKNILDGKEI